MKSFLKKIFRKKVILGILLISLMIGLIFSWLNYIATNKMERAFASIRAFKDPVRWQEVIPKSIPSTQNAYASYKKALVCLPDYDENSEMLDTLEEIYYDFIDKSKLRLGEPEKAFLNQYPEISRFMEESLQRSDCQYPIDYSGGFSIELTHLTNIKSLLRFSLLQTLTLAEEKQYRKAENLLKASLKLARSIENEPFIISYLVEIAMYHKVLKMSFNLYQYYPEMREAIRKIFEDRPKWNSLMIQKIKQERALSIDTYLDIINGEYPFTQVVNAFTSSDSYFQYTAYIPRFITAPFMKLDMVYLLDGYKEFINYGQMNPWYALKSINESRRSMDAPFFAILSHLIEPAFAGMYARNLNITATEELFMASLEVMDFISIHKKFPEEIHDLLKTSKNPFIDPFNGNPYYQIRYNKNTLILGSVGENLRNDQAGKEFIVFNENNMDDIGWVLYLENQLKRGVITLKEAEDAYQEGHFQEAIRLLKIVESESVRDDNQVLENKLVLWINEHESRLIKEAENFMKEGQFRQAIPLLDEAQLLKKKYNTEVVLLREICQANLEANTLLEEAKDRYKKGRLQEALDKLAKISNTSLIFPETTALKKEIETLYLQEAPKKPLENNEELHSIADKILSEARKYYDEKNYGEAKKSIQSILELSDLPESSDEKKQAKALYDEIAGRIAAEYLRIINSTDSASQKVQMLKELLNTLDKTDKYYPKIQKSIEKYEASDETPE